MSGIREIRKYGSVKYGLGYGYATPFKFPNSTTQPKSDNTVYGYATPFKGPVAQLNPRVTTL